MGFINSTYRQNKSVDYDSEIFVKQGLPRGSLPGDLDMVFHNKNTHKLLIVEIKEGDAPVPTGQKIMLRDLEYDENSVNPVRTDSGILRNNKDGSFKSFLYHGVLTEDEQEFYRIVKEFLE